MTDNTTTISREDLVLALLVPHKNGLQVALEAGKQRTGTATSVFHKGQQAVWRVIVKDGDPAPHVQIQVGDVVRRCDDASYEGFKAAVTALFEAAVPPTPMAAAEREAQILALTPAPLQAFMAAASQPNGADQTWTFDIGGTELNSVTGQVTFLRGKPDPLTLNTRVEMILVKGKPRLMLAVGEHDPVRVRNIDDAIEVAYDEFDLHCPGQQRHLLVYDDTSFGLSNYLFHTGTRISRLASAAHGLYVNIELEGDNADAIAVKEAALEAFKLQLFQTDGNPRYAHREVDVSDHPLVQRIEIVTVAGFAA